MLLLFPRDQKTFSRYRDSPGNSIKCGYDGALKDIFQGFKPKQPKKIYYQKVGKCFNFKCSDPSFEYLIISFLQLTIRIDELENKKQFKCSWFNPATKEDVSLHSNNFIN